MTSFPVTLRLTFDPGSCGPAIIWIAALVALGCHRVVSTPDPDVLLVEGLSRELNLAVLALLRHRCPSVRVEVI